MVSPFCGSRPGTPIIEEAHFNSYGKIILDKKGEGVILFMTTMSKRQRSPKVIWGFRIFRDKDALFKAKIALERA
jgi:hypothetical protein